MKNPNFLAAVVIGIFFHGSISIAGASSAVIWSEMKKAASTGKAEADKTVRPQKMGLSEREMPQTERGKMMWESANFSNESRKAILHLEERIKAIDSGKSSGSYTMKGNALAVFEYGSVSGFWRSPDGKVYSIYREKSHPGFEVSRSGLKISDGPNGPVIETTQVSKSMVQFTGMPNYIVRTKEEFDKNGLVRGLSTFENGGTYNVNTFFTGEVSGRNLNVDADYITTGLMPTQKIFKTEIKGDSAEIGKITSMVSKVDKEGQFLEIFTDKNNIYEARYRDDKVKLRHKWRDDEGHLWWEMKDVTAPAATFMYGEQPVRMIEAQRHVIQ